MANNHIEIIEGNIFKDERGRINSVNDFHFENVRRCYMIRNANTDVVRGWNGHKYERKWFYCIKGSFAIGLVEIDNWESPSKELSAEVYQLDENQSKILAVPTGYANCLKAMEEDSIIIVYSDKTLDEAAGDNWKYDSNLWVNWSQYNKLNVK